MGKVAKVSNLPPRKVLVPTGRKRRSPQAQRGNRLCIPSSSSTKAEERPIPCKTYVLYGSENFTVRGWGIRQHIKEIYDKINEGFDDDEVIDWKSDPINGFLKIKKNILGFPTESSNKEEFLKEMVKEKREKIKLTILSQLLEKVSAINLPARLKQDAMIALYNSREIFEYSNDDALMLTIRQLRLIQQQPLLEPPVMSLDDIRSRKPFTKPSFCHYICERKCEDQDDCGHSLDKRVTRGSRKTNQIPTSNRNRPQLICGTTNGETSSAAINPEQEMPKTSVLHTRMRDLNEKNTLKRKYEPCRHQEDEICNENCSCYINGTYCEKFCNCNESCTFRFRGCNCLDGQCTTNRCICFKLSRECDPDLCGRCGAKGLRCHNVPMQLGLSQPVFVKRSKVHGQGLFAKHRIWKGDFVMEMTGEIISYEESNRRADLFNSNGHTFQLELTNKEVLDCSRAGNQARYLNSSTNPNLEWTQIYVEGHYRVGIYALCSIEPGKELLINYEDIIYDKRKELHEEQAS